ncbi:MAG: FkbM family methyltransferase [Chloroflexota bacterium]
MQRFLKRARDRVSTAAAGGLCAVSAALPGVPQVEGFHVARVLGGPLRGKLLAMPTLQRPSYALGTFEPHVSEAMRAHVRPGSVAYDIGANIGYHTLVLADLVGEGGTVIAFEPAPQERLALEHNLRLNDQPRVQVEASALAEQPGQMPFATFGYSGIGRLARATEPADATILTVPTTTLDAFVYEDGNPPPDFLKIDVEGAELRVLLGGMRLLAAQRPVIVCEVRAGSTLEQLSTLLAAQRYAARVLHRSGGLADVLFTPAR